MKLLMLSILSFFLLSNASGSAVIAANENRDLETFISPQVDTPSITPSNLVSLADRGYFQDQGIPSYMTLIFAHQMGTIRAQELVEAAVNTNRLSSQFLTDQNYLNTVDFLLENFATRF